MLELINKWVGLGFCLYYLRNAVSETAWFCMFDDKKRKQMYYCTITSVPRQVSLFSFSNIWLLPVLFFSQSLSQPDVPAWCLTGCPAPGPSWLLSPASATTTISFSLFNYLFKTRLFRHIRLALSQNIFEKYFWKVTLRDNITLG